MSDQSNETADNDLEDELAPTPDSIEEATDGRPKVLHDLAYRALREGDLAQFETLTADEDALDYSYADLAGVDLRKAPMDRMILRGARLKRADLRGLDLSGHDLEGVSLNSARISGVLFPRDLSATEILMSVEHGTRIRHRGNEAGSD